MTKEKILDAIFTELEFYRSRQLSVHYFSIASILLVVTGQQKLPINDPTIARWAYTVFFLLVPVLNWMISASYQERVYQLRDVRAKMFADEQWPNTFPAHSKFKKLSPNLLYTVIVSAIAALAILVVWIGK